jgi:Type II CAAX prenyl endopeptidase Rce1-like
MGWAYLLLSFLVVCGSAFLRYSEDGLLFAAPAQLSPTIWLWGMGGIALLAVLAVVCDRGRLQRARARAAFLELLLLPAAFAYEWLRLPARARDYAPVDWAVLGIVLGGVGLLVWRDTRRGETDGLNPKGFLPALRCLILPTALMMLVPVAISLATGTDATASGVAVSLLTYPAYAFVQLVIFQVFLVPRLRRLSSGRVQLIVVAAGMFSLLHWPNGVLMGACWLAAGVWTWVYLERRNVFALAISMALAATAFTHAIPHSVTEHARVGPIYVLRLMDRNSRRARNGGPQSTRTSPVDSPRREGG